MVEDTGLLGDRRVDGGVRVRVRRSVAVGVAVRRVGDDVRAGAALYPAGTFVTPAVAGVLASAYGIDAAINTILVRPVSAFARSVLAHAVDGRVDRAFSAGGSLLARTAALVGARLQDGDVGKYAWLIAAGALAVLAPLAGDHGPLLQWGLAIVALAPAIPVVASRARTPLTLAAGVSPGLGPVAPLAPSRRPPATPRPPLLPYPPIPASHGLNSRQFAVLGLDSARRIPAFAQVLIRYPKRFS